MLNMTYDRDYKVKLSLAERRGEEPRHEAGVLAPRDTRIPFGYSRALSIGHQVTAGLPQHDSHITFDDAKPHGGGWFWFLGIGALLVAAVCVATKLAATTTGLMTFGLLTSTGPVGWAIAGLAVSALALLWVLNRQQRSR